MRSSHWQYFGFPADSSGNILTKKKIICTLCKSVLAYNKNTTNLKSHINAKHKEFEVHIKKLKVTEDPKKKNLEPTPWGKVGQTTKNWVKIESNQKSSKYMKLDTTKDNEFEIEILESSSFDGNDVNENEEEHYSHMEVEDNTEPEFVYDAIEVTSEPKSYDIKTVIVNWITADLLSTNIAEGLGFQIMMKTIADNELPNREEILEELNIIYSYQHSENYSRVQKVISDRPFSLSFEKWKNFEDKSFINVYIHYLKLKTNDFDFVNTIVDVLYLDPNCDERIDWDEYFNEHSSITFDKCSACILDFEDEELTRFIRLKNTPIVQCLTSIFRTAIDECFELNSVKDLIKCSDQEKFWLEKWKILENSNDVNITEIVECLNPLEKAVEGLAEEQINPALSIALINQLCEFHYTSDPDVDSKLTQEIKDVIKESLSSGLPKGNHAGIFLLIDPRFKDSATNADVVEIKKRIQEITVPGPKITEKKVVVKTERGGRKSGFDFLFAKNVVKCKVEKRDVLDEELKIYREDESISLESCPITWWMENGYSYPNLKKIADIYNCVPACVNAQLKLKFNERIDFHKKRFYCRDDASVLEKLVYLHMSFK